MKKIAVIMTFSFLISLLAVTALAQETLNLIVPLPLSGFQAKFGEMNKRSYEIAMEEINAGGGIKGKKIVLKFEDSMDRPAVSRSIVKNAIDVRKQPIIFGEYSSACARALAALAEEEKVPYLVVSGSADVITKSGYKYVFRMTPQSAYFASGMVSFLKDVVKPKTTVIIYEGSEFGMSSADDFKREAEKAGIAVVWKEPFIDAELVGDELVYYPELKWNTSVVKALKPDVIFMAAYTKEAVMLMDQIKTEQIGAKIYAGGGAGFASPDFVRKAKGNAEYVVTTSLWSPGIGYPGAMEFTEKYEKRFREAPSYHAARAYSALYVIKNVLERAETWKPDDIREALKSTNMITAFGPIKFEDKEGYTNQNFMETLVEQVINGRFEIIWPEKYAARKCVYPIPK